MDQDLIDLFEHCFVDHVDALFENLKRKQHSPGHDLVELPVIGGWDWVENIPENVTAQEVYLEALWRITPYGENLSGFAGLGR